MGQVSGAVDTCSNPKTPVCAAASKTPLMLGTRWPRQLEDVFQITRADKRPRTEMQVAWGHGNSPGAECLKRFHQENRVAGLMPREDPHD